MKNQTPKLRLSSDEKKAVTKGFNAIQRVLQKRNVNIEHVIGLVTTDEISSTAKQVKVKFAEEPGPGMNMIAFD